MARLVARFRTTRRVVDRSTEADVTTDGNLSVDTTGVFNDVELSGVDVDGVRSTDKRSDVVGAVIRSTGVERSTDDRFTTVVGDGVDRSTDERFVDVCDPDDVDEGSTDERFTETDDTDDVDELDRSTDKVRSTDERFTASTDELDELFNTGE